MSDVGVVAIPLRLSKKTFDQSRSPIESRVYAILSGLRSTGDLQNTYSLNLAHDGDRTSAFFSGALAIHARIADDGIGLFLGGQYDPTAGIVGRLSDRRLGHRIAQASASNFLNTIGSYVKISSARNEAARAGKYPFASPGGNSEMLRQRWMSRYAPRQTQEYRCST